MQFTLKQMEKWPLKTAVTVCGSTAPTNPEIRSRLKRRGWEMGSRFTTVEKALHQIESGRASVLIIEDSTKLPVAVALRQILSSINGLLTPTIAVADPRSAEEKACFSSIGHSITLETPLNPSKFIENFEYLIHRWSQSYYADLYYAGQDLREGNVQNCIKKLSAIMTSNEIGALTIAGPCLSLFFRNTNLKTSEKILLSLLGKAKKNMGVILSLVDLYLNYGMPNLALRLLKSAEATYNRPKTIALDQIQTFLLLNMDHKAIPILERMIKESFMPEWSQKAIKPILYTCGKHRQLKSALGGNARDIEAFIKAWTPPKKATKVAV